MKPAYLLIFSILFLVAGFTFFLSNTEVWAKAPKNTILYSDKGFLPAKLKVKGGTMITFTNQSSKDFWPASDIHPTHAVYPEKGGCISSAFDACKGLKKGESWSFTFNQKGSWKYHDHLRPSKKGRIIVK